MEICINKNCVAWSSHDHGYCLDCYEKLNKLNKPKCKKCGMKDFENPNSREYCCKCSADMYLKEDIINKPSHYHSGSIDPIKFGEENFTFEEMDGFYKMNIIKYVSRAGKKDDVIQDLNKAKFYLDKLIESKENGDW